jgi:hypothetical protein
MFTWVDSSISYASFGIIELKGFIGYTFLPVKEYCAELLKARKQNKSVRRALKVLFMEFNYSSNIKLICKQNTNHSHKFPKKR